MLVHSCYPALGSPLSRPNNIRLASCQLLTDNFRKSGLVRVKRRLCLERKIRGRIYTASVPSVFLPLCFRAASNFVRWTSYCVSSHTRSKALTYVAHRRNLDPAFSNFVVVNFYPLESKRKSDYNGHLFGESRTSCPASPTPYFLDVW